MPPTEGRICVIEDDVVLLLDVIREHVVKG